MLEAEVETTIMSELRSTVASDGGNAQGVQNSDLPAGGTLQMFFHSLHFLGLSIMPLQPGCKLPLHQFTAQAPSPKFPFPLISAPYRL